MVRMPFSTLISRSSLDALGRGQRGADGLEPAVADEDVDARAPVGQRGLADEEAGGGHGARGQAVPPTVSRSMRSVG